MSRALGIIVNVVAASFIGWLLWSWGVHAVDPATIGYVAGGVITALVVRLGMKRLKVDAPGYWTSLSGMIVGSPVLTVLFWPFYLLLLCAYYIFEHVAARNRIEWIESEKRRHERERENPFSSLPLDELLKKVDEQKRTSR